MKCRLAKWIAMSGMCIVLDLIVMPACASDAALITLHSFSATIDGEEPYSGLVQGTDGNFYGTTDSGGNGHGTVFKITPDGALTTLHEFNGTDGDQVTSGVIQGRDGNLYGVTRTGGAPKQGTVFKLTTSGAFSLLYTFTGGNDGGVPESGLIQGTDGDLYGTTAFGGPPASSNGTVYKITPSGVLTTLYSFCPTGDEPCLDGTNPFGGLVQGSDGNFYGTTEGGGSGDPDTSGAGTVFKMTAGGVLTTLYSFQAGTDGVSPRTSLVQSTDGNFFGTTYGSETISGTVFKITPSGTLTALGNTPGGRPSGPLLLASDGNFYGATGSAVFELMPNGTVSTIYTFCKLSECADGSNPIGSLAQGRNGGLFGTTLGGGANKDGTVFKLLVLDASTARGQQIDFFGTGKSDFTVWRPGSGYWYIDGVGASAAGQWGASTDLPVIGDFDGDGKSDFAVFRPSTGYWYITQSSNGEVVAKQWGASTDTPVAGDFDGDGKSDIAVFRPSTGYWYIVQSSTGEVVAQQWGASTDIPVPGDFDGDGKSDIAVYRPSTGYWYIVQSSNGQVVSKQWGATGDLPVARDYDGDGKTDIAVWRPSTGYWYVVESSTGQTLGQQWGAPTDIPINNLNR